MTGRFLLGTVALWLVGCHARETIPTGTGGSSAASADTPVQAAEVVARLPQSVGNVTFTREGRMIFSHHPFFEPAVRVAELEAGGTSARPFPTLEWNTPRPGTDEYLDSVLGVHGDEEG